MLKRTITYEDYDGKSRTIDAYFNMNKSELTKWLLTDGDYTLDKKISRLFEERNAKEIMSTFEELLDASYGVKSLDGDRFEKSPQILQNFKSTLAYDAIFMELVTDAKKAAEFLSGIMPKDLGETLREAMDLNIQNHRGLVTHERN